MTSGELIGLDWSSGLPIRYRWTAGRIVDKQLLPSSSAPPERSLSWIAPPLTELQINGYGGIDFQRDHLTEADLLQATKALERDGCGRFLLTLITDDWPKLIARLAYLRQLRATSALLQHRIVGWHVEGPFLSSKPGFHGAHEPQWMIDPTPARIRELRDVVAGDPLLLTLAPERAGSMESIAEAVRLGIRVSLGHTDANAEVLAAAVGHGASGFTHLGNGCPQLLDRHDNILWRVLNQPGLQIGLIPDSFHVSPQLFRLFHRLLPAERIFYVTDAMSAGGAPPGRYPLKGMELEVGPDQVVRKPGTSLFAGSALSPINGVVRATQMLSAKWQEVWRSFSEVPSLWIGLPEFLEVGSPAEFCLVAMGENGTVKSAQLVSAQPSA